MRGFDELQRRGIVRLRRGPESTSVARPKDHPNTRVIRYFPDDKWEVIGGEKGEGYLQACRALDIPLEDAFATAILNRL